MRARYTRGVRTEHVQNQESNETNAMGDDSEGQLDKDSGKASGKCVEKMQGINEREKEKKQSQRLPYREMQM